MKTRKTRIVSAIHRNNDVIRKSVERDLTDDKGRAGNFIPKIIPPSLQHPPQRVKALNYLVNTGGKKLF